MLPDLNAGDAVAAFDPVRDLFLALADKSSLSLCVLGEARCRNKHGVRHMALRAL